MKGALLVFAKEPRPGAVKTRMCPPLSPAQAAGFYAALLDDVLEVSAAAAARLDLAPHLYVSPPGAVEALARRAPGFRACAQSGKGLGARMGRAMAEVHALGHAPLLLRGSDSPLLGEAALRQALRTLEDGADLALAPDQGGGYLLVAMRRPVAGIFDHAMSTTSVLDDTLARARAAGLTTRLLEPGFDVDTGADLSLLARARWGSQPLPCPRALAYLDQHDLWPIRPAVG